MSLLGVDVSHWQGVIDWAKAKAAGVVFGFAKATESDDYTDPRFTANIAGMRAAGVVPGAYHFLRPGNASGQADRFVRTAPPDVIHALDVEASDLDVAGWVKRYRASYPDKTLLIYTGRDLWARAGGGDGARFGPLWVAGYVPNRYLAPGSLATVAALVGSNRGGAPFGGWTTPAFLQFTDAAIVPGIPERCDGDVFYGTLDELKTLTSSTLTGGPTDMPLTDTEWTRLGKLIHDEVVAVLTTDKTVDNRDENNQPIPGSKWSIAQTLAGLDQKVDFYVAPRLNQAVAQATGQATQLATIITAVQALAAGSAPEIQAAFAAGVQELKDQLAAIHVVVSVDSQ